MHFILGSLQGLTYYSENSLHARYRFLLNEYYRFRIETLLFMEEKVIKRNNIYGIS